jgi:hypothetical protein
MLSGTASITFWLLTRIPRRRVSTPGLMATASHSRSFAASLAQGSAWRVRIDGWSQNGNAGSGRSTPARRIVWRMAKHPWFLAFIIQLNLTPVTYGRAPEISTGQKGTDFFIPPNAGFAADLC